MYVYILIEKNICITLCELHIDYKRNVIELYMTKIYSVLDFYSKYMHIDYLHYFICGHLQPIIYIRKGVIKILSLKCYVVYLKNCLKNKFT